MKKDPWVLIAGGFHRNGGMDKANLALAEYLISEGHQISIVSYSVAPHLSQHSLVETFLVHRPLGSFMLAEPVLDLQGRAVARRMKALNPKARVVTNGGSCRWDDINWAHCVHQAWHCKDYDAPFWFQAKNRLSKRLAVTAERRAFRSARVVIANSEKTRRELIELTCVDPSKVHTVYPGAETEWKPPTDTERKTAKQKMGYPEGRPIVVFVGALGLDNNKGFDILWAGWQHLCQNSSWDAHLIVAGSGNGLSRWKARTSAAGLANRVTYLGFSEKISDLLGAADLLISPVRYESYGLNVQEAICRGVPSIVSASAGVAERFPQNVRAMLLRDPGDASGLIEKLRMWRSDMALWRTHFQPFGTALRMNSWRDMASQIVAIASENTYVQSRTSVTVPLPQ